MFGELPVLPPPFSSPLLPYLSRRKRKRLRGLMLAENPHCFYCRQRVTHRSSTLDHLIPVARGGQHVAPNLVLCCEVCNTAKGPRTPGEWLADLARACAALAPHQLRLTENEVPHASV